MTTVTMEDLEIDLEMARAQIPDTMDKARRHYNDFLRELTDEIEEKDEHINAQRALKAELDELQAMITTYGAWLVD